MVDSNRRLSVRQDSAQANSSKSRCHSAIQKLQ